MRQALRRALAANRALLKSVPIVVVGVLAVYFAWTHAAEAGTTVRTIREANPTWVVVIFLLAFVVEAAVVFIVERFLQRLGYPAGFRTVARAHSQRIAIGTLSPLPGAGLVAFTSFLRPRGVPAGSSVLALALQSLVGLLSFCMFLVPVLILLVVEGRVSALVLGAAAVLAVAVLLFAVASAFVLRSEGPPAILARFIPARLFGPLEEARNQHIRIADLVSGFAMSMGVDIACAAMLGAALMATGNNPGLTVIVAAYAVGTMFMLVAPFFAGAGIVEVGTVLALRSLNVPIEQAVAATILFRLGQVWLPFGLALSLGVGTHGQVRRMSFYVPAIAVLCGGVLAVGSLVGPPSRHMRSLQHYEPLGTEPLSRFLVLISGFMLIYLSTQLWQRKRSAWWLTCAVLGVTIPAHLLRAHDRAGAVVYGFLLLLLLLHRRRFNVRGYAPSPRATFLEAGGALVTVFTYGVAGFWFLDERVFGHEFTLADAISRTARMVVFLGDPGITPRTNYGDWFLDSLQLMGAVAIVFVAYTISRPVRARKHAREADRLRAQAIITAYGNSSLDYFKYAKDKLFFFGSDGESVVAYGVYRGTAVALGDPVAASDKRFTAILTEFMDFARRNSWRVAFHQVPPESLPNYKSCGLTWMKIGEEAIVDISSFTRSGRSMKGVRSTLNRLERDGYRGVYLEPPLDDDMVDALRDVSDQWLSIGNHRERRFTLGQFDDAYARAFPALVLENKDGEIVAFVNVIPDGAKGEATIDLMRRTAHPDGAMDYLFVRLFEMLRDRGVQRFSLGLAPFANTGGESGSKLAEKAAGQLFEHGEKLFGYKGLHSYKDKFNPAWEARYLVYENELTLPLVTLAIIRLTE